MPGAAPPSSSSPVGFIADLSPLVLIAVAWLLSRLSGLPFASEAAQPIMMQLGATLGLAIPAALIGLVVAFPAALVFSLMLPRRSDCPSGFIVFTLLPIVLPLAVICVVLFGINARSGIVVAAALSALVSASILLAGFQRRLPLAAAIVDGVFAALITGFSAELIKEGFASQQGLGFYLTYSAATLDLGSLFLGAVVIAAWASALSALRRAIRLLLPAPAVAAAA